MGYCSLDCRKSLAQGFRRIASSFGRVKKQCPDPSPEAFIFADAKGGFMVEKTEPAGDILPAQVDDGVVDEEGAERGDNGDEQDLIKDPPDPGVIPRRRTTRPQNARGRVRCQNALL